MLYTNSTVISSRFAYASAYLHTWFTHKNNKRLYRFQCVENAIDFLRWPDDLFSLPRRSKMRDWGFLLFYLFIILLDLIKVQYDKNFAEKYLSSTNKRFRNCLNEQRYWKMDCRDTDYCKMLQMMDSQKSLSINFSISIRTCINM